MKEIKENDSADGKSSDSQNINTSPKISLEIFEIEEPIYTKGGDQNDPGKRGDCDS